MTKVFGKLLIFLKNIQTKRLVIVFPFWLETFLLLRAERTGHYLGSESTEQRGVCFLHKHPKWPFWDWESLSAHSRFISDLWLSYHLTEEVLNPREILKGAKQNTVTYRALTFYDFPDFRETKPTVGICALKLHFWLSQ